MNTHSTISQTMNGFASDSVKGPRSKHSLNLSVKKRIVWFIALTSFLFITQHAFPNTSNEPSSMQAGTKEAEPLQVKGQTRTISLMNVNKSEKDNVKFVSARKSYKEQILKTVY